MNVRWLAWLGVFVGLTVVGSADAAKKGDNLYIKAKNTKVMKSSAPTASVVTVLQPGESVVWQGSDAKNKKWHKVQTSGKKGVVFKSNLSTKKPKMEMVAKAGGKVDPKAFASSGAATKALGEGTKEYGKKKSMAEAVSDLAALDKLAETVGPKQINEHVAKARLFKVVGDDDE